MDMNLPIFPAPPGYSVDLANPQRSGAAANFWVGGVGMVLAAFFMGTRLYTKLHLARKFSADDGALVLAWVFSVVIQMVILFQYARGTLGIHIWELTGNQLNSAFNLVNVASILYCPFLASAKFSLLFLYLKLSPMQWFRVCVYGTMFLVVGYNLALVFPLIFGCTPIIRGFDISVTEGSCIDRTSLYIATAALNMGTDIILLVLPIPMIVSLQMPCAQKAGIICIFAVGSATCVTSAVRLVLLFPMLKTVDLTWAIVTPGLWILVEANLVIITGSLPALRLFFRHVVPRLTAASSTLRSHKPTAYAHGSRGGPELQTISSKPMRKVYDRMGETDSIFTGSDGYGDTESKTDTESEAGIMMTTNFSRVSMPAQGILKTETTIVTSEAFANRHELMKAVRGPLTPSLRP